MTSRSPALPESGPDARQRFGFLRLFTLVVATLVGLYVCYLLALPFVPALILALSAAVLALPLHRRLEARLRRPNLAAAISLALLAGLVFLPLTFLANALYAALGTGLTSLQEQVTSGELQRIAEQHSFVRRIMSLAPADLDISAMVGNASGWLANLGATVVRGSLSNAIMILLTFYLVFYFLRDHREALHQIRLLSPLTHAETDELFTRISDTIHAVIFGTVVTSAVQGALGGGMFWLLGLPNPVFWGVVMALVAIIPILGTFVVWLPAAAYLALGGDWGKAAVLVAWGTVVIGGIDNVIYPILAGGRLRLHTVPTFIAIVGGLALFGAAGLVLGPLVVVMTLTLLHIWRERAHVADAPEEVPRIAARKPGRPYAGQGSE